MLGSDLGIYVVEPSGALTKRIDSVKDGKTHHLALDQGPERILHVDWLKVENKRTKEGPTIKQLTIGGLVKAEDIVLDQDQSLSEKLKGLESSLLQSA